MNISLFLANFQFWAEVKKVTSRAEPSRAELSWKSFSHSSSQLGSDSSLLISMYIGWVLIKGMLHYLRHDWKRGIVLLIKQSYILFQNTINAGYFPNWNHKNRSFWIQMIFLKHLYKWNLKIHCVQGQSGFYNLVLTEENMQNKFDLKLSVYSRVWNKRSPLENLAKRIIVAPFLPYTMKSGIRP